MDEQTQARRSANQRGKRNPRDEDSLRNERRSAHRKRRAADEKESARQVWRRCAPLRKMSLTYWEFVMEGRDKRWHENRRQIRNNDAAFRSLVAAGRHPIADMAIFAIACLRGRHETCLDGIRRVARQSGLLALAMHDAGEPIRQHQQRQGLFSPIHALTNTSFQYGTQCFLTCREETGTDRQHLRSITQTPQAQTIMPGRQINDWTVGLQ